MVYSKGGAGVQIRVKTSTLHRLNKLRSVKKDGLTYQISYSQIIATLIDHYEND